MSHKGIFVATRCVTMVNVRSATTRLSFSLHLHSRSPSTSLCVLQFKSGMQTPLVAAPEEFLRSNDQSVSQSVRQRQLPPPAKSIFFFRKLFDSDSSRKKFNLVFDMLSQIASWKCCFVVVVCFSVEGAPHCKHTTPAIPRPPPTRSSHPQSARTGTLTIPRLPPTR